MPLFNELTTLLYVTALPVHMQRCYNVSFFGQGSLKNCSISKTTGKTRWQQNNGVFKRKESITILEK